MNFAARCLTTAVCAGNLLPWGDPAPAQDDAFNRAVEEATRMGRRAVLDVVEEHTAAIALYDGAGWTQLGTVEWSLPGDLWFREFVYLAPGPRTGRGGHCDVRGWTRRFGA